MTNKDRFRKTIEVIGLMVMLLAGALLVFQHFSSASLPGCGPTSACGQLAATRWGRFLGIPVSILGLAYALALALAGVPLPSTTSPTRVPWVDRVPRVVPMIAASISLFYLGLMMWLGRPCLYCIAFHSGHLVYVATIMSAPSILRFSTSPSNKRGNVWIFQFAGTIAAVVLTLTSFDRIQSRRMAKLSRDQSAASVDRVIDDLGMMDDLASAASFDDALDGDRGFTGRHPRGADATTARLVVFQDYQCGDCRQLETQLQSALDQYPDLHVSVIQFPLCDDCNPQIHYPWFHPEACRAAYLAEAVDRIAGKQVFWIANDWLFERKAQFDDNDLRQLAEDLAIDPEALKAEMGGDNVRRRVAADIDQGVSLGIASTPFVFLNGVAIEGAAGDSTTVVTALDRLAKEVERREKAGDPVVKLPPDADASPPLAADRIVKLWREAKQLETLPQRESCQHVLGDSTADERVILFLEPTYSDAGGMWRMLHELVAIREASGNPIAVELYLYPISRELNPRFADRERDFFPRSTTTTQMLKAIDQLAGDAAFGQALTWISNEGKSIPLDDIPAAVTEAIANDRWNDNQLQDAMASPEIAAAIDQDLQQAKRTEITWAPNLIIGGRISPSDTVDASTVARMLNHAE